MSTAEVTEAARPGSVADVLRGLELTEIAPLTWEASSVPAGGWVFGGQLIGQAIAAATAAQPGKQVTSIHTIFARAGAAGEPIRLAVSPVHGGRSFGSVQITMSQGERVLASASALLAAPETDLIRRASQAVPAAGPDSATPQPVHLHGWDQRYADGADIWDPAAVGPPQLTMWSQVISGVTTPVAHRALVAWASVGSFIGTAMRPHPGLGLAIAHHEVSSGVLSHTLTFHDDVNANEWLRFNLNSTFAGAGRVFGTGQVFTAEGDLVASCQQEAFLRPLTRVGGL